MKWRSVGDKFFKSLQFASVKIINLYENSSHVKEQNVTVLSNCKSFGSFLKIQYTNMTKKG